MSASHPLASDEWTAVEWRAFRDQQQAAVDRFSSSWGDRVGRPLVALADRRIDELGAAA